MIQIYDTTLRDGSQGEGISLSLQDKLNLTKRLDEAGFHYIEGGWPGSNPKDMAYFNEVKKLKLKNAKVAAFGSTRRAHKKTSQDDNVKALLEAKTKAVTIFGKSWDFQVKTVFKIALKENLAMIEDTVHFFRSKKIEVIYDAEHFFDGFKENPEYAMATLGAAVKGGANYLALCDTNGGSLPELIREGVRTARVRFQLPLGIHCHNDMDLAVANSVAAVDEGCVMVQGTMNGYGERCGNANLTSIIPALQLKMGKVCLSPKHLKKLTELSHYVAEVANMPMENGQPFAGFSAFAHKGGVHVNAVMKNAKTYEHIEPETVGNIRRFLISELSGRSNILEKAKAMNLPLDKDSPATKKILDEIQELENEGYHFEAAEASFELLIKKALGKHKKFFELSSFKVSDEKLETGELRTEATVKISVNGEEQLMAAEGDGPVHALDQALRKAIEKFYPIIRKLHLVDYKVRVINAQAGTAAKVRVFIQFQDEKEDWSTIGVSTNVIDASCHALIDGLEYKLLKS